MKTRRPPIWVAVAYASLAVLSGCGGAASRFNSHMSRGQQYYATGDYTHAGIEFRNAMQIDPKNVVALKMTAHNAEKLGRLREAAGLYQAAIDIAPDDADARADLGRLFVFGLAPDRALATVDPALIKHPDHSGLLTARAAAYLQQGRVDDARKDADAALRAKPDDESAISLRAAVYQSQGDLAGAAKIVTAGLEKLPNSAELREILVNLSFAAGDAAKGETQLKELVAMKPADMRLRKQLALYYAGARRLDDAQHVLEDAVKVSGGDDAKSALAEFVASERDVQKGKQIMRGYVSAAPDNLHLRILLAELLERHGAAKDARDVYVDIIKVDEKAPEALVARDRIALAAFADGKEDEARRLIAQVLEKSPRDNDALLLRARIALAHDDPGAAIVDLRSVLKDQPTFAPALQLLAESHLANAQPELAEQALRSFLEVEPKNASARNDLARVLVSLQKSDQAIQLLESAVRADPQNPDTRVYLIRTLLASKEFARARKAAADLQTLAPKAPIGFYLAAMAEEGAQQPQAAMSQLEQARALEPGAIQVLTEIVRLQLSAKKGEAAVQVVQNALDHDIDAKDTTAVAAAENLQGEVYLAMRQPAKAIAAFEKAAQHAPGWVPPKRNLAAAKLGSGDVIGATDAYQAAVAAAPTDPGLVTEYAVLLERQGRVDEAIKQYDTVLARKPRQSSIANNLAMLLVTYKHDQGSLDRARDLTAALTNSQDGTYLDTAGWVYFKRGDYSQALPVLERAVQHAPTSKEVRYHLAMAEMQAGLNARARSNLEAALAAGSEAYPWANEARTALASLKQKTG